MCDYCNLENYETIYIHKYKDIESNGNFKLSMAYSIKSEEYMLYTQTSNDWLLHKIKYCPFCGRKLVDE